MVRVSLDRLLEGRGGRIWSSADAMAYCPERAVVGFTFPRHVSADALLPIAALIERLVRERREARALVLDFSRVAANGCDELALASFNRFVVEPLVLHPQRVRQVSLVAGQGFSQCALIGAVVSATPTFPWEHHRRLELALEGLCHGPGRWVGEVVSLVNSELTPIGLISRVRAVVGDRPAATIREVAQVLAVAPRSLQRALSLSATTFHDERLDVRLELAASRLSRTRQKVSTVARDVGYQSLPHFLAVFRARFGVSPRAFRSRHQEEGAVS